MTTLQVSAKGQLTLEQDLLRQLGISSGDKVEAEALPNGGLMIRAARRKRKVTELFGLLKNKGIHLSLDEIAENSQKGWSGER
jgi:antitoxin component of MazEF toxin-antitoxin module